MRLLSLVLLFALSTPLWGQESSPRWHLLGSVGQYPASLAVPRFDPLHPGLRVGMQYQWNQNPQHQWVQTGNLGFFMHPQLQNALQLYTETGYQINLENGLVINPIMLGGGYVLSMLNMPTLDWDETTQQYTESSSPTRHNFLASVGANLGWRLDSGTQFFLAYRLQIQGIMVQNTIPVIAYSPLMLGIRYPLSFAD
jgi:hypothetical protein